MSMNDESDASFGPTWKTVPSPNSAEGITAFFIRCTGCRFKCTTQCVNPLAIKPNLAQQLRRTFDRVPPGNIPEQVDHPAHYGGADNPYEAIKVIEAWGLDKSFNLGNAVKYISRAEAKGDSLTDLRKARWYLDREISNREKQAK
jgi:hypothetical protein